MDFSEKNVIPLHTIGQELESLYDLTPGTEEFKHQILKINNEFKITPVSSEFFKEKYFAARPASERLINKKLELRQLNIMRDWRVGLKEYIENYYQDYLVTAKVPENKSLSSASSEK